MKARFDIQKSEDTSVRSLRSRFEKNTNSRPKSQPGLDQDSNEREKEREEREKERTEKKKKRPQSMYTPSSSSSTSTSSTSTSSTSTSSTPPKRYVPQRRSSFSKDTENKPSEPSKEKDGQKEEKRSITHLLRRKDKGKSGLESSKKEDKLIRNSSGVGIEKETEKEKVISWLENTDQKKKKMPFKKGKKSPENELSSLVMEVPIEGTVPSFLASALRVSDSRWFEEDDAVDLEAMSIQEKASYFIGEIPNQEDPGPEFSNELIWPPFNPLGAYKGKLKDGIPHGEGELMCFNGNKYIGDWKLGRRDGQGKMFWSCGNIFTGQFKDDKKHGTGEERQKNKVLLAEWQHGKPHGKGVIQLQGGAPLLLVEWSQGKIISTVEPKKL